MARGMINITEKSLYRRIIEKYFDNEKDIEQFKEDKQGHSLSL